MNEKVNWSVYSCSQNLPAILNDPTRGKQKDFFTKHWGETFIVPTSILPSPRLEEVPHAYFASYCRKLLKRSRKLKKSIPQVQDPLHAFFPHLAARETSQLFKPETSPIPRIYFTQNFNLSNTETFREVFEVETENIPTKLVQDKLSHYLDLVEVGLAQQISKKSSAFFSAVSTQDKVAEKVTKGLQCVQQIKDELSLVRNNHVVTPLTIIKLYRKKFNKILLYQKLQLMTTVHQAQRTIQSLLGNSDYVGALDLISTTQEVLREELQGLFSFRHLDSQLIEIRNAIEKMLRAELERNLSADLNRPIEQMDSFIDKDRLLSIILGFLRLGKIAPIITVLSKEINTSMTTTCKQTLIEAVSESDSKSDSLLGSNSVFMAIPQLPSELWMKMITNLGERLLKLLLHIQEVIMLFQSSAFGQINENTKKEIDFEKNSIHEGEESLISIQLFSNFSNELVNQLEKTTTTADEKYTGILRYRPTWLVRAEFFSTLTAVRIFVERLENFNNCLSKIIPASSPKSYRYASTMEIRNQANEFFRHFHERQTEVVNKTLDRERWRVVPEEISKQRWPITDIQTLIENMFSKTNLNYQESENGDDTVPSSPGYETDINQDEDRLKTALKEKNSSISTTVHSSSKENEIRTAEIFFIILTVVAEYCYLVKITGNAEVVLGVVDLLRLANARIAHLILGAGAVELRICRSITVANLAVVVRGLCLLVGILSEIKDGLKEALPTKNQHLLKHVDAVQTEISRHSEDVENKMISIVSEIFDLELQHWEAKPPVPSIPIKNISGNIFKFREAIGPVLTSSQISDLFLRVDRAFRIRLKERISTLGILKDGGPKQGVVTSEMMHYLESLRKLNVLPANVVSNTGLTNELWSK